MATTTSPLNWRVAGRALNAGQLWANLSLPGAGGKLNLHTNGTPDAVTNPQAIHLGATKAGSKLMVKPKYSQYYVDEFRSPIDTQITEIESMITADLVGVTDMELAELLSTGFGTKTTDLGGAGVPPSAKITFGTKIIQYTSIAHIFPLAADPTKFGVWHLYRALNEPGLEFSSSRKELGFTPVSFRAYEITTRALEDTFGAYWIQT